MTDDIRAGLEEALAVLREAPGGHGLAIETIQDLLEGGTSATGVTDDLKRTWERLRRLRWVPSPGAPSIAERPIVDLGCIDAGLVIEIRLLTPEGVRVASVSRAIPWEAWRTGGRDQLDACLNALIEKINRADPFVGGLVELGSST